MIDERDVLDRLAPVFPVPEPSFERFTLRRERKRRNQRITSAIVALVIATVAIGWAATVFLRDTKERPAQSPVTITPGNVSSLHQSWAGQAGVMQGGILQAPFVADGIAYVVSDRLFAFDAHCKGSPTVCARPLWVSSHATISHPANPSAVDQWAWPPAVADGVVYVVDRAEGTLYAYSESCGTAGETCRALWTEERAPRGSPQIRTHLAAAPPISAPIVEGSTVYVASGSRLYAFSTSCTDACRPTWTGGFYGHDGWTVNVVAADGFVFVTRGGELWAFPDTCDSSTCGPLWTAQLPGANFYASISLAVDAGRVYVGRSDGGFRSQPLTGGLYAFAERCGSGGVVCRPLWSWLHPAMQVSAADGMVFVAGGYLRAFSDQHAAECSGACEPSWQSSGIEAEAATEADGMVYVQTNKKIMAFPESCGSGSGPCHPYWVSGAVPGPNGVVQGDGAPPVVAGDLLFGAPYRQQSLFAYGTSCGKSSKCMPLWTGTTSGLVTSAPTVAEGALYVATGDSKIVAFEPSVPTGVAGGDGDQRWVLFVVGAALLVGVAAAVAIRWRREHMTEGGAR